MHLYESYIEKSINVPDDGWKEVVSCVCPTCGAIVGSSSTEDIKQRHINWHRKMIGSVNQ